MPKKSSVACEMSSLGRQMEEMNTQLNRFKQLMLQGEKPIISDTSTLPLPLRIFHKCTKPIQNFSDDEEILKEYDDIVSMLQELQTSETKETISSKLLSNNRVESVIALVDWMTDNGVDTTKFEIFHTSDYRGIGIRSKTVIQAGETIVKIPRKFVMAVDDFKKVEHLKDLFLHEPMMRGIPNIFLAICLLAECYKEKKSTYYNYLSSLPGSYCNVSYFTKKHLEALRDTCAFREAFTLWRHMVRQYAYLKVAFGSINQNTLMMPSPAFLASVRALGFHERFCFDDYRWAIATVMTRVNLIPANPETLDSGKPLNSTLALVPLLDLFNHDYCTPNIDYDSEENCCEVLSAIAYPTPGEEIFINYGTRGDLQYLLHNGFLPSLNYIPYTVMETTLPSKHLDCAIHEKASKLLKRVDLGYLTVLPIHPEPHPWNSLIVAFLRVVSADEQTLDTLLSTDENSLKETISDREKPISEENEKKAISLLNSYLTSRLRELEKHEKLDQDFISDFSSEQRDSEEICIFYCISFRNRERNLISSALGNLQKVYPFLKN